MLPDIHLDQMTFEEMLEKAKNRIASTCPEWTDFNYHDPGITLIELFAWLKEIQQYELDHIGDAHRRKYLSLLGQETLSRRGASAFVKARVKSPLYVPAGSRMEAPGVPFETERPQLLPGVSLGCAFGWLGKRVSYLDEEQLSLGHTLKFYPFGQEALQGTCLYLCFREPLPKGQPLSLTVWTASQEGPPRNPAGEDTLPLAKLSYGFWNGSGYRPLTVFRDETFGFLFDGQLTFSLSEDMEERSVDGETGYFLRVRLEESQYELPPVLADLDVNTLKARQRETLSAWLPGEKCAGEGARIEVSHGLGREGDSRVFRYEEGRYREVPVKDAVWEEERGRLTLTLELPAGEFETGVFWVQLFSREDWYQSRRILGEGRGFPGERFSLEGAAPERSSLELLVEEPEEPGVYRKWEKQKDFSRSGPEDRHYCVDSQNGVILFGDCIRGMAPEGRILLISCSRTLGSGGNVKAGKIQGLFSGKELQAEVFNPQDAWGGRDEESLPEAFRRVRGELLKARNLVAARDYEQAVKETPGLRIESCKALAGGAKDGEPADEQEIRLVVKPCSLERRPRLTPAFVENIRNYLEPRRMLGVRLRFLSPAYAGLSVYLEATVRAQYQGAGERIEEAVREYLSPCLKQFGQSVSYSGLYGHIDRLECVSRVRSLFLDARGNGVRKNAYGDLVFPGNGIADAIEIQCSCLAEE